MQNQEVIYYNHPTDLVAFHVQVCINLILFLIYSMCHSKLSDTSTMRCITYKQQPCKPDCSKTFISCIGSHTSSYGLLIVDQTANQVSQFPQVKSPCYYLLGSMLLCTHISCLQVTGIHDSSRLNVSLTCKVSKCYQWCYLHKLSIQLSFKQVTVTLVKGGRPELRVRVS